MDNNKNFIDLLRHYRHDWLNVLQIIKGNIALNRLDRVENIINDIVIHTENESKLSNLQIPKVAYYFITYNWQNHSIHLDYEIIGDVVDLSEYEETIYRWCSEFIHLLNECCYSYMENSLYVKFQLFNNDYRIIFDFAGKLPKREKIVTWLNSNYNQLDKLVIDEVNHSTDQFIVEVCLK